MRQADDVEAVFAAFEMAGFPYRTFPAMPAPHATIEARLGGSARDRGRDRARAEVGRPGSHERHTAGRRAPEREERSREAAQFELPRRGSTGRSSIDTRESSSRQD